MPFDSDMQNSLFIPHHPICGFSVSNPHWNFKILCQFYNQKVNTGNQEYDHKHSLPGFHKIYLETGWQFKNAVINVSCILVNCKKRLSYYWCQYLEMFQHAYHFIRSKWLFIRIKISHLNKEPRRVVVFEQCMSKLDIMTNITNTLNFSCSLWNNYHRSYWSE